MLEKDERQNVSFFESRVSSRTLFLARAAVLLFSNTDVGHQQSSVSRLLTERGYESAEAEARSSVNGSDQTGVQPRKEAPLQGVIASGPFAG